MKPRLLFSLAALLCPLTAFAAQTAPAYPALPPALAAPSTAPAASAPVPAAPASPFAAAPNNNRVQGRVTAIDTVKRTITVDPRGAQTPITVSLAPDAKFYMSAMGTLASLKVGDHVSVYGAATPDAPALSSDRIVVLPAESDAAGSRKAKRTTGFHPKRVEGIIVTIAPALTLSTPGHVTVTVTPSPAVRVETLSLGSLTGLVVGQTVQARVMGGTATLVASEITVLPARAGGHGRKRAKANGSSPAPLDAPDTAAP